MATESPGFEAGSGRRLEELKGAAFEYALVGATVVGLVALVVLVALVTRDAFGLTAAAPAWYLVFFLTLVVPTALFVAYARRRPPVWRTTVRLTGALLGGLALAGVCYTVPQALDPRDVYVYVVPTVTPVVLFAAYGRLNPATTWAGLAAPVGAIAGVALAAVLFDPLRGIAAYLIEWFVYVLLVAVPAAAVVLYVLNRRADRRRAALAAGAVLAGSAVAGIGGGFLGYDGSVAVVFVSTAVTPVALVVTAVVQREGIAGLAGPPVVVGGTLVGATVTGALGIAGPDSWVSVTLLTESFSTLSPERAGAYPQLVGSVILVGLMAILIFPVGIGAAVFLEEYAPDAGPLGRLAQFLQVNISNLAGVPSVVYGLLGLGLFVNLLGQSRGLLVAASVTLGLLILPIVIVSAQEAIRSVPDSHRQASYGIGASRWQTVRNVVLPEAFPGILTGTILSLGRAIGETAPILLVGVATSKTSPPAGLFEKATALPLQVFASRSLPQPEYRYGVLAAAVIVLLALMLSMNAVAILLRNRYQRRD